MIKKSRSFKSILLAISLLTSLNVAIAPVAKALADCNVSGITSGSKVYYFFKTVGVLQ